MASSIGRFIVATFSVIAATTPCAFGDYRADYLSGCRALEFYSWGTAAAWFHKALRGNGRSLDGPIWLSGQNTIPYLPHYVIGVAEFARGHYDEALHEWRLAETEWSNVDRHTAGSLKRYRRVIAEGRAIYRDTVCADAYNLAVSVGGEQKDAKRAKSLCEDDSYGKAVDLLVHLQESSPKRERSREAPIPRHGDGRAVNLVVKFSKEISDCEAPAFLRDLAFTDSGAPGSSWLRRRPYARASTSLSSRNPGSTGEVGRLRNTTPEVTRGGSGGSTAELIRQLRAQKVLYTQKAALIIAPEYRGAQSWEAIPDVANTIAEFKKSLAHWKFNKVEVNFDKNGAKTKRFSDPSQLSHDLEKWINDNAPKKAGVKALIWVHVLGHVFAPLSLRNDGWLALSDAPMMNRGDEANEGKWQDFRTRALDLSSLRQFMNQAPHHLVFTFETCPVGKTFLVELVGTDNVVWEQALHNPAFLFVSRGIPTETVGSEPVLTKTLTKLLDKCAAGVADSEGVVTGHFLFNELELELRSINTVQVRKYTSGEWGDGDVVLGVPERCH